MSWCHDFDTIFYFRHLYEWATIEAGLNLRENRGELLKCKLDITYYPSQVSFHTLHGCLPQTSELWRMLWYKSPLDALCRTEVGNCFLRWFVMHGEQRNVSNTQESIVANYPGFAGIIPVFLAFPGLAGLLSCN